MKIAELTAIGPAEQVVQPGPRQLGGGANTPGIQRHQTARRDRCPASRYAQGQCRNGGVHVVRLC